MAKPVSWRLDRSAYPFVNSTETRFQDLDPLGHVNNVAMAALFENGRVRFNRSLNLTHHHEIEGMGVEERWLIASVAIDYVAEAHFPYPVDIASGIGRIGTSSWTISAAAFQGERCVATSDTVLVFTGPEGPRPLPDAMREAFASQMIRQPSGD